ncbi:MAG: PAS domain S-box protein [Syntrophomonas sp.]
MKTINTYYDDYRSLETFVRNNYELLLANKNSAVMVQVFSGICDENYLLAISNQVRELIPGAQVIGTTTNGEIMNGLVSGLKTVLSFSVFHYSNIKVALAELEGGNDYELGRSIGATLYSNKARVLILFTTGPKLNASQLLKGVQSVNAGLPVAGGSAGNNRSSTQRLVSCNGNVTDCGVVGVVLESDHLTVSCHSHLGWQSIGKEMTITRAEGSRVYTIDHIPAFQVYRRYLGIGPTSDIMDAVEFPLIIYKHGLEIARSPAVRYEDDSIGFFGDMAEGDKVRFSFGHVEMIIKKMDNLLQLVKQRTVESIFVYSCASRRGFLQDSTQIETLPLQNIAPTAGFFTSGEFFHADNSNQLLNATMTTLVLSESGGTKHALGLEAESTGGSIQTKTDSIKDNVADRNLKILKGLTHLINTVTGELNTKTSELEATNLALHLSEERFSKAFSCNPDPISVMTLDEGRYVEVNDAWVNQTGYKRDEVIGRSVNELGIWLNLDERDLILKKVKEQGFLHNIEITFRSKAGEIRFCLVSAEIIDMGNKPYLLFVDKDITDLKRTEIQLEEERNFNAVLLDTAGDLIAVCDQEGHIVVFNKRCEQITGFSINEVRGRYIWEIAHSPEDMEDNKALFDKEKTDWETPGFRQKVENYWVGKDGKRRLISWTITHIIGEQGSGTHAIGIGKDIIDQRTMEERLRKSEAELRIIMENANGIVYSMSKDGICNFISNGCKEATGFEKEEIVGQPFLKLVHPDDLEMCNKLLKKVVSTGMSLKEFEFRVKHREGSCKWHSLNIAPVNNENGNPLFYVGICVDISERKQAEEDIRYLSYHDKLTGLYNRTFFEEELKRISTNRQLPIGLIIGDVNGLKLVNDALGHLEGDKVLIKTAEILRNSCRQEDIISRWGGDEFIILLPRCDSEIALRIIKRINDSFLAINDLPIQINMSLGMAIQSTLDKNIVDIIREAEEKMYRNKLLESRSNRSSFIKSVEKTLWEKSHETKEHCQRMQEMAQKMGNALGLTDSDLDNLKLLAALHDIGKITIPDSILDKPGKLSPDEWETIKNHPETGYRIALSSPELAPIAEAILHHHEWWDGSGYPLGLKGEKIPLLSRIIAITDAYDVMLNGRPYKKAVGKQEAWAEIERCAGTQFDPELVRKVFFFD